MKENGLVVVLIVGFYFIEDLLVKISVKGVEIIFVMFYVGFGIFCLVDVEDIINYKMYFEFYCLIEEFVEWINKIKV